MWKELLNLGKQLFKLGSRVHKLEEDVTELREALKEVREEIEELRKEGAQTAHILERLVWELDRDRDMAARERANLILRLDNALLRFERRLPPGTPPNELGTEEL